MDIFIELSKQLDNEYQIILIGLNKKQKKKLPSNIIGITRTENIEELVKWYSATDIFFNPTLEDNYPTTNLEAIACGTPVLTFETGGSPESALLIENSIISKNDLGSFIKYLQSVKTPRDNLTTISIKEMNKKYNNIYNEENGIVL